MGRVSKSTVQSSQERNRKSVSAMTLYEVRELIRDQADWMGTSPNGMICRKWLSMPISDFIKKYDEFVRAKQSSHVSYSNRLEAFMHYAGAMKNGAIIIPEGWSGYTLYDYIGMRIREAELYEFGRFNAGEYSDPSIPRNVFVPSGEHFLDTKRVDKRIDKSRK